MSSQELIESLRRTEGEKLRLMKQEAEREAEALRADVRRDLENVRTQCAGRLSREAAEETRHACADAENRARRLKLAAEQQLSGRLLAVARASLLMLRGIDYPAVFEKLARELPDLPWMRVTVNPDDRDLARVHFPGAEIIPAPNISGGIDAATGDGTIRVVNTFENRLERAWEDLLPQLMEDIYRETVDGASPRPC